MTTPTVLARRFKLSALLITSGLVVETVTLFWSHPMTFLTFLFIGGVLVAVGVAVYLLALVL